MPRPNCVDDFLLVTTEIKNSLYRAIQTYHTALNKPGGDCPSVTKDTHQVCYELIYSASETSYIGGLIGSLNLCNLWTIYRNYKGKKKPVSELHACAIFSSHLVRHIIEKIIFETDKFFLCAPCSSITVPKSLAAAMFNLLSEARKRALGQNKLFGTGRVQMMTAGRELIETYISLNKAGQISEDLKKFIHIVFIMPNVDELFKQIYDWENNTFGKHAGQRAMVHALPRRRAPNRSVFSDAETRFKYVIPGCLMMETYSNGTRVYDNPDLTHHMSQVDGTYQKLATLPTIAQLSTNVCQLGEKRKAAGELETTTTKMMKTSASSDGSYPIITGTLSMLTHAIIDQSTQINPICGSQPFIILNPVQIPQAQATQIQVPAIVGTQSQLIQFQSSTSSASDASAYITQGLQSQEGSQTIQTIASDLNSNKEPKEYVQYSDNSSPETLSDVQSPCASDCYESTITMLKTLSNDPADQKTPHYYEQNMQPRQETRPLELVTGDQVNDITQTSHLESYCDSTSVSSTPEQVNWELAFQNTDGDGSACDLESDILNEILNECESSDNSISSNLHSKDEEVFHCDLSKVKTDGVKIDNQNSQDSGYGSMCNTSPPSSPVEDKSFSDTRYNVIKSLEMLEEMETVTTMDFKDFDNLMDFTTDFDITSYTTKVNNEGKEDPPSPLTSQMEDIFAALIDEINYNS